MNEIMKYSFGENEIRTKFVNGETWFVLKDVCDALGIVNSRSVADRLDEGQKGVDSIDTLGGGQEMIIINEAGLYDVVLRSDKPAAKPFRDWVTQDVLPSIRKKGYYSVIPDDQLAVALVAAMDDSERLEKVIIPALRAGNIDQSMLVAKYMGLSAEEYGNNPKLIKKSNKNLSGKHALKSWERMGLKVYKRSDLPEGRRDHPATLVALKKVCKKYGNGVWFAEYCGELHFIKQGYEALIDTMVDMGYLSAKDASVWKMAEGFECLEDDD